MRLQYNKTLVEPSSGSNPLKHKVVATCWSPDNERFAIATAERAILLYNGHGERVDKFNSKPKEKGDCSYFVWGMQFCSDIGQPKLAVAQSDCIVFVYKWSSITGLPKEDDKEKGIWSGKKTICNKFPETSSVTSILWPTKHPFEIFYGLLEGSIKVGNLRSNKSQTLYKTQSCVVAMATNLSGNGILTAHHDGSIYRILLPDKDDELLCTKIIHNSFPAYALAWGRSICVGGNNQKISFYDAEGNEESIFAYQKKIDEEVVCREFTVAASNLIGDTIAIGNFDFFIIYTWSSKENVWIEQNPNLVQNMYTVTSLSWKADGSSLAVGTMSGLVDLYDACLRRYLYKNSFEITYVSPTQVQIRSKDDASSTSTCLNSKRGKEISKISIHQDPTMKVDRFLVAYTETSLLLCDLQSQDNQVSEIEWSTTESRESFIFDSPNACIIKKAGELSFVEVGFFICKLY